MNAENEVYKDMWIKISGTPQSTSQGLDILDDQVEAVLPAGKQIIAGTAPAKIHPRLQTGLTPIFPAFLIADNPAVAPLLVHLGT